MATGWSAIISASIWSLDQLSAYHLKHTQAAKALGITQARVSDIKRGKFGQFSLDMLVRLASRAGLKPRLKLAA